MKIEGDLKDHNNYQTDSPPQSFSVKARDLYKRQMYDSPLKNVFGSRNFAADYSHAKSVDRTAG